MSDHPSSISGGCLCGSVRYRIAFADDASWPPNSATCQCTMCRKFTGALISHDLLIHPSQLVEDVTRSPTYKEYQSSESATRSFCSECGSSLSWRVKGLDDFIVIFLGTVDEEFLIGTKVDGTEETTALGVKFQRKGGLWKELCNPNMGSLFWNNTISGVTDHDMGETKFLQSFPQE